MFDLFKRNRNFRLLFSGAGASNLSDGIGTVAFPWIATLLSTNPFDIALVAFAIRLPWLLLALPVGVWTDWADRQRLMVWSDLVRMAVALGVVALVLQGQSGFAEGDQRALIIVLAGLAFLMGTAELVRDNTAQTALPTLVQKDELETANGQLWSIENVMGNFIGPPLAGALIALAVPAPFLFEAFGFAIAAYAVWRIDFPKRLEGPEVQGFWRAIGEGIRWIWRHKVILRLAILLGLINAMHVAGLTYLVLYAQDILGLGSVGYGALLTAGAVGGVAGGLLAPGNAKFLGQTPTVLVALAMMPVPFLVMALTSSPVLVAAVLILEAFTALMWNVVTVSYRQRLIPDALLGRVNSIYRFFGWGMMPLGAMAAGLLMAELNPMLGREDALRLFYLIASGGLGCVFLYGAVRLRLP